MKVYVSWLPLFNICNYHYGMLRADATTYCSEYSAYVQYEFNTVAHWRWTPLVKKYFVVSEWLPVMLGLSLYG